jgi:hypothetical protein
MFRENTIGPIEDHRQVHISRSMNRRNKRELRLLQQARNFLLVAHGSEGVLDAAMQTFAN